MADEPPPARLRPRLRYKAPINPTLSLFAAIVSTVLTVVLILEADDPNSPTKRPWYAG